MGQQAVVTRTGLDKEREVNKRVLNTLILNTSLERTSEYNRIELNRSRLYLPSVCLSVLRVVCYLVCAIYPRQPTHCHECQGPRVT